MLRISRGSITVILPAGVKRELKVVAAQDDYNGVGPLVREVICAYLKMRREPGMTFECALALVRDELQEK